MINIKKDFKEQVEDYKGIAIVDFWASWCGPCKMFGPVFEEVSNSFNNIKFCKLNVDENEEVCSKLGVMSIPTTIVFKEGNEVKRNVGFINKEELIGFIGDSNV